MSLSNFVTLTITRQSVGIRRAGFGVPLILSHTAAWAERYRTYESLADVAVDFPETTCAEYRAAEAIFSQSPCPELIAIGRGANKPTQIYILDAVATDLATYALEVAGDGVTNTEISYVAEATADQAEIHYQILTALNAVVGKNYTATYTALVNPDDVFTADAGTETFTAVAHGLLTGDGPFQVSNSGGGLPTGLTAVTDYWIIRLTADTFQLAATEADAYTATPVPISTNGTGTQTIADVAGTKRPSDPITVTGSAAGEWFSIGAANPALISVIQTYADPGVAADLTAIALENPNWYCLLTNYNSNAYVEAAAGWVQSNNRIYVFDTPDTLVVTGADGSSDTVDDNQTAGRSRVLAQYHNVPADMLSAALAGRCLPIDPGGETWALKRLIGPSPVTLTSTQRGNLTTKFGNSYEEVTTGLSVTFDGKTGDGDYLDVQRGIDWMDDDVRKSIMEVLVANDKIIFDNPGIRTVAAALRGSLDRAKDMGIILSYVIQIPTFASQSTATKAARTLTGLDFSAVLASAIQKVNVVGSISL